MSINTTSHLGNKGEHVLEINIQRELSQIISMEIKLIVLEIFDYFHDGYISFQRQSEIVVECMGVGGFEDVEEGLHFFEVCAWRGGVFLIIGESVSDFEWERGKTDLGEHS